MSPCCRRVRRCGRPALPVCLQSPGRPPAGRKARGGPPRVNNLPWVDNWRAAHGRPAVDGPAAGLLRPAADARAALRAGRRRTRPAACGGIRAPTCGSTRAAWPRSMAIATPPLTTDGEAFDQTAMAAANQTLPLPAIALVTNLETGRQVKLRINDRGPPTPRRMLAVTRRVAQLLGFPPSGVARVRLQVLESESQAAQNALPGAPKLAIATAPRGAVAAASLAPPPGARGSSGGGGRPAGRRGHRARHQGAPPARAAPAAAMRLPETVTQVCARSRHAVDRPRQLPGL